MVTRRHQCVGVSCDQWIMNQKEHVGVMKLISLSLSIYLSIYIYIYIIYTHMPGGGGSDSPRVENLPSKKQRREALNIESTRIKKILVNIAILCRPVSKSFSLSLTFTEFWTFRVIKRFFYKKSVIGLHSPIIILPSQLVL